MTLNSEKVRLIFGLKLKHLRQEKGVSLSELAAQSGLSVSYLNEIEKGKKYPKAEKIVALAAALGVDYDALVSMKLSKKLEPIAELLRSNILSELPLEMLGLDAASLLSLLSDAPAQIAAFISTLIEISRNYGLRVESFYFSVLRSFQEMHDNHFPDLEAEAERFLAAQSGQRLDGVFLETFLKTTYGYQIEPFSDASHPDLAGLRSVLFPGAAPHLLLNDQLGPEQRTFTLAREMGYEWLGLKIRSLESSVVEAESFAQVLNNFRASYFARAILMPRRLLTARLKAFFALKRWDETVLPGLLTEFQVTPELLLLRVSSLLSSEFGLNQQFFLRFDHVAGQPTVELAKEMHLARLHNPHGTTSEHYCRRWVSLTMLQELADLQTKNQWNGQPLCRGQVSEFVGTSDRYLALALAKPSPPKPGLNSSITLGLAVDDALRKTIKFLDDPALGLRIVNETCERCPLPDCQERVAPPTEYLKLERKARLKGAMRAMKEQVS